MMEESERLQILEMIEKGIITASEGVRLLNSLQAETGDAEPPLVGASSFGSGEQPGTSPEPEVTEEAPPPDSRSASTQQEFDAEITKWRRWWWVPLTIGIGITVVSGLLMFLAFQNSSLFWFGCLWVPFLFGVLIISLAAASRTTRWLHVRVQQEPGGRKR
jgi:SHOCT-like domain